MAYSPVNVANNLLRRAFEDKVDVSPMKLQKLLYFVASEYAKRTHRALLDERFQAWQYGPVVRSVYDEFRTFGGSPITSYGKDAQGRAYAVDEGTDSDLLAVINRVWQVAKNRSAVQLSRITHSPGSAWANAYRDGGWINENALENDDTYVGQLGLL